MKGICPICGGEMVGKSVDVIDTINGKLVIIRGISAEVLCGAVRGYTLKAR